MPRRIPYSGADHRLLWSVWEGLRPAKFHEKAARTGSSVRRMFAFWSAFVFFDFGWFFDPATLEAGRRHNSIVCPTDLHR